MNSKSEIIRKELEQSLLKKRLWLYSYAPNQKPERISDEMIIQKFLSYGDKRHWEKLKLAFPVNLIRQVWLHNLVPASLNDSKQERIAREVFHISKPSEYLERKQKEHKRNVFAGRF